MSLKIEILGFKSIRNCLMDKTNNCWQKIPDSVLGAGKKERKVFNIIRNNGQINGKSGYSLVLAILYGFEIRYRRFDRHLFFDSSKNEITETLIRIHDESQSLKEFRDKFAQAFPKYDVFFSKGQHIKGLERDYFEETKIFPRSNKGKFYEHFKPKTYLWYHGPSDYCSSPNYVDYCTSYQANQSIIDIAILPNYEFAFKECMRTVLSFPETYEEFMNGVHHNTHKIKKRFPKKQLFDCLYMGLQKFDAQITKETFIQNCQKLWSEAQSLFHSYEYSKRSLSELFFSRFTDQYPEFDIAYCDQPDFIDRETVVGRTGTIFCYNNEKKVIHLYQTKDKEWCLGF